MKTVFFTLMSLFFILPMEAQHSSHYYRDQDRYQDRSDIYHHHHNSRQYSYNTTSRYLPIKVRRELRELERKLAERKRCAWEDGHISRRDARRIRDVENDIAELLYRYNVRGNYYSYPRSNSPYCR